MYQEPITQPRTMETTMATPITITDLDLDPASETYIPRARDVRIGVHTRCGTVLCLCCADQATDDAAPRWRPERYRDGSIVYAYGDSVEPIDGVRTICDRCDRDLTADADRIDAAHDAQQRRWSRMSREVTYEIVGGGTFGFAGGGIRCY